MSILKKLNSEFSIFKTIESGFKDYVYNRGFGIDVLDWIDNNSSTLMTFITDYEAEFNKDDKYLYKVLLNRINQEILADSILYDFQTIAEISINKMYTTGRILKDGSTEYFIESNFLPTNGDELCSGKDFWDYSLNMLIQDSGSNFNYVPNSVSVINDNNKEKLKFMIYID